MSKTYPKIARRWLYKHLALVCLAAAFGAQSAWAHDVAAEHNAACRSLLEAHPEASKYFKFTTAMVDRLGPSQTELLAAALGLAGKIDDKLWLSMSQSLIRNPEALATDAIASNPFFRVYPSLRNSFVDVTYTILKSDFGDVFDDYQLGLLAAVIPEQKRIVPLSNQRIRALSDSKNMAVIMGTLLDSEDYGSVLLELLAHLGRNPSVTVNMHHYQKALEKHFGRCSMLNLIESTIQRLAIFTPKAKDATLVSLLISCLGRRIYDEFPPSDSPELVAGEPGVVECFRLPRDWAMFQTESYFARSAGFRSSIENLMTVFGSIATLDPVPTPKWQLRAAVMSGMDAILFPVRQGAKDGASIRAEKNSVVSVSEKPFKFAVNDAFKPPPRKTRVKTRGESTKDTDEEPEKRVRANRIDPIHDLHLFSTFVDKPRPLDQIDIAQIYEFRYLRADDESIVRMRFSDEVRTWILDNPRPGRQMIGALILGRSKGDLLGTKLMVSASSRRWPGSIFEIKIFGKFRPLAIVKDGVWQILTVATKDDLAHKMLWLKPLP